MRASRARAEMVTITPRINGQLVCRFGDPIELESAYTRIFADRITSALIRRCSHRTGRFELGTGRFENRAEDRTSGGCAKRPVKIISDGS